MKNEHPPCPRCFGTETRRVRNYGRPVGNEFQCLDCGRRWEEDMAKKPSWIKAAAIKVVSPPPKNVMVSMPIVKDGKILGELHSDLMTQAEADALVKAVNDAIDK
jgi:transposase-like protein